MKSATKTAAIALATVVSSLALTGCFNSKAENSVSAAAPVDGQLGIPGDYRSWPKFVNTVDKAKAGQVREIYINTMGKMVKQGDVFPNGTESVMEIYAAKKDASGALSKSADGSLVKGDLKKIFFMKKGENWGAAQPAGTIDNGDWVYSAYLADAKTAATADFTGCRGCHAPLTDKDFVHRYDEHFASR